MTQYCNTSSKATVNITYADGTTDRVISNNPYVDVNVGLQVGTKKVYLQGTAYGAGCAVLTNYKELQGTLATDISPTLSSYYGGSCGNSWHYTIDQLSYDSGTQWLQGSVSIVQETVTTVGWLIAITDKNGATVFSKTVPSKPSYTVGCGEECPPGFCKCPTDNYPGYCCNDCSATKASIQNILSDLRSKNG